MANAFIFSDLASTTLTSPISTSSTSMSVASGAAFPNPTTGQQFAILMTDAATGLVHEIIYVTANASNTFTIVRGQEGTVAAAWVIGDSIQHIWTAGTANNLLQLTGGTASGTITDSAGFIASGTDANGAHFRATSANYGVFLLNDNRDGYLLQTASGSPLGVYNAYRPFSWNLSTGAVNIDGSGAGTTLGGNAQINGNLITNGYVSSGGVVAGVGSFTLSATTTSAQFNITTPAGYTRDILFQSSGLSVWTIGADNSAQTGGNAGSNFFITRSNDSGTYIDSPMTILRSTGVVGFSQIPYHPTPTHGDNSTKSATTAFVAGLFQNVNVVTGSRAIGTTYTNNSGSPMFVSVVVNNTSGALAYPGINVNGQPVISLTIGSTVNLTYNITAIVNAGGSYYVFSGVGGAVSLISWVEIT